MGNVTKVRGQRKPLQYAGRKDVMAEAKVLSDRLESVLRDASMSALRRYLEAKDDLLAIHDLKLSGGWLGKGKAPSTAPIS